MWYFLKLSNSNNKLFFLLFVRTCVSIVQIAWLVSKETAVLDMPTKPGTSALTSFQASIPVVHTAQNCTIISVGYKISRVKFSCPPALGRNRVRHLRDYNGQV